MPTTRTEDSSIAVYRDGVMLGWRTLVVVGVAIIGMYVASHIAPLSDAIGRLDERLTLREQAADMRSEERYEVRARLKALERDVSLLQSTINTLNGLKMDHPFYYGNGGQNPVISPDDKDRGE